MSSDRADRYVRQERNASRDVHRADDDQTVDLGPLAGRARQGVASNITQPSEADTTIILPPLAWEMDQGETGSTLPPPEDDLTVVVPRQAWGTARDQLVVGTIPQQLPGFLPRPTLLAQLDHAGRGASVVQTLTGIPGAGKTQLAAAYARGKLTSGWRLVAWINAKDTGSVLAGLAAVADAAGLTDHVSGRDAADLGQTVRQLLEADGERCLLVFDDVKDPDVVRPFVPGDGKAQVLITSTSQLDLGVGVPVDVFSEEEALAFLAERTGLGEQGAAAVAGQLGYLPFTLAQAAAVMAGQRTGYATYLGRLRTLSAGAYLTREKDKQPYPRGVAESVLLSIKAVRADDPAGVCAGILETMAVLSEAGIRRELLYAAGQAGILARRRLRSRVSAALVDRALARLAERSLLTFSLDDQTVIAHSLVMQIVRERLARRGRLAAVCWAVASVMDTHARTLAGTQDPAAIRDIPEQVTALQVNAAGSGAETDHELAKRLLSLQFWALYHLSERGDSASRAVAVGEPLVADFEREFGRDHPETVGLRNRLALAYLAAGRASEAILLFKQILASQERLLGVGHPDTLTTQNGLAAAYQAAGRAAEAFQLLELTLAAREQLLGVGHPDTLTTRNNLAAAYWDAGLVGEAIRLFEQTLAAREQLLGADHTRTLNSRGNLAAAYRAAGRAAEAVPLFEQTLATCERQLGADHPKTLKSRDNLVAAYRDAGRDVEATRLLE